MTEKKPSFSLMKPMPETPFHIDFQWWEERDRDWRVHLRSLMCETHRDLFAEWDGESMIDWVDPETAEVKVVDGMRHTLMTHCALEPNFLTDRTSMVESVFRLFLMNGNQPLSSEQLSETLGRPAMTILKTLASPRVYRGLRPCCD